MEIVKDPRITQLDISDTSVKALPGKDLHCDGTYNGGMLRLGTYYLWVDAGGLLRIHTSRPAADDDGDAVGDQTDA